MFKEKIILKKMSGKMLNDVSAKLCEKSSRKKSLFFVYCLDRQKVEVLKKVPKIGN